MLVKLENGYILNTDAIREITPSGDVFFISDGLGAVDRLTDADKEKLLKASSAVADRVDDLRETMEVKMRDVVSIIARK